MFWQINLNKLSWIGQPKLVPGEPLKCICVYIVLKLNAI